MLKNRKKATRHLAQVDPVLALVIAKFGLPKREARQGYFMSLCRSIIGQQLSVRAAATIASRVFALFKNGQPAPRALLRIPDEKLRNAGLSGSKVAYLKNLATFAIQHKAELEKLKAVPDEEIIALLTQVKGIGRWTVEMFLIFTLGREDVFSHADLGLRNALKKLYRLRGKPSLRTVKRITDKWMPYRSYASLYLWASLG